MDENDLAFIKDNFIKDGNLVQKVYTARKYNLLFERVKTALGVSTDNKSELIWLAVNGGQVGKCRVCGKPTKFKRFCEGYATACSMACTRADPTAKQKRVTSIKKFCNENYGVDNVAQRRETQEKMSKTVMERYGAATFVETKEFAQKVRSNTMERYGVEHPGATPAAISKRKATMMARYGRPFGRDFDPNRQERIAFIEMECQNRHISHDEFSCTATMSEAVYSFTHTCGETWTDTIMRIPACPRCQRGSSVKVSVKAFCATLNVHQVYNDRSTIAPLELDILFPDHKLAIEVNGLYWHCDGSGGASVVEKTNLAEKAGVHLISIWEHEWKDPRMRVKLESLIRVKLGLGKRVFARKLIVDEDVPTDEARQFLNENHLQGWAPATNTIALRSKTGEIQILLSWGRRLRQTDGLPELIRLCSKLDTVVVGGFSRLLKHVTEPELISYCDRRFGAGDGYSLVGFTLMEVTIPNYIWWKGTSFAKRSQTTRKSLPRLLGDSHDPTQNEVVNMMAAGWRRLSDAGNLKLKLTQKRDIT
jgi:hypothetical protein